MHLLTVSTSTIYAPPTIWLVIRQRGTSTRVVDDIRLLLCNTPGDVACMLVPRFTVMSPQPMMVQPAASGGDPYWGALEITWQRGDNGTRGSAAAATAPPLPAPMWLSFALVSYTTATTTTTLIGERQWWSWTRSEHNNPFGSQTYYINVADQPSLMKLQMNATRYVRPMLLRVWNAEQINEMMDVPIMWLGNTHTLSTYPLTLLHLHTLNI